MCRLLGIVASEATQFRLVLQEAPRSIATLSREHSDGWGIAIHDRTAGTWKLDKGVMCAGDDSRFHELAVGSRGELLIAHIRKKTVGATAVHNTHPFQRDGWIFAHNGTIKDLAYLREGVSAVRRNKIEGQTDSELFFAFLLSRLDDAHDDDRDDTLVQVAREARAREGFGSFNFLLSNGRVTYAHRFGRSLFLLERRPHDEVRVRRASQLGAIVQTPWSQRRHALFIASERLTDEPWEEIGEGSILRLDAGPSVSWRLLA